MTFGFDPALADPISRVRFHCGDTNEEGFYIHDETIDYLVTTQGANQAVISCIDFIITQLSAPNFKLDWLTVSVDKAREGFEALRKQKQQEFGIVAGFIPVAEIKQAHRADSYENKGGVYTDADGAP